MIDWQQVARLFPVNDRYVWLNACGTAPPARPVVEAVGRFMAEYAEHGIFAPSFRYPDVVAETRDILSRLLRCRPHEVALVKNTAEGMNLLSLGLDLRPGDEILLLEKEYPSNVYPWEHWATKGVRLAFVPLTSTPEQFLEGFTRAVSARTRVVALSAVHWCTGMPLPMDDVARLCAERDILLVLDLAQGAGHVPIDLGRWRACAAFSAWKWLMGPLGLGGLVVPDELLPRFAPVMKGTDSVVHADQYLPYKAELKPSAERYMYSTGPMLDYVYFRESLRLLDGLGFDNVAARIFALAARLRAGLADAGFSFETWGPGVQSGIVTATRPGFSPDDAAKKLHARGIFTRERDGRLRMATHVHLSEAQIDATIEALRAIG